MTLRALSLAALLAVGVPALAHEVEKGPNGGRVVDTGTHHVELVTKATNVDVYVTDKDEKPVAISGYKGLAILTVSGKAQRIALSPKDANRLNGTSPVALPAQAKGVVQLTAPDGKTSQGRF